MTGIGKATPHDQLIEEIMDSCRPSTEREWAARTEIVTLKGENERLRKGLVCPTCRGRDFHNTNTGLGLEHKDGRLFCSSECLVRAIRNEDEAALGQEISQPPVKGE